MYYCFGCHKGGSLVNFVMEMERVSYPDAIRMLADRAHMEIPEEIDERALKQQREKKERLYEANRMAARFFYDQLKGEEGRSARAYLTRRGVSPQTAVEFGLGFAPREWEALTNALLKEGFSKEELVEAGLAVRSKKGEDGAVRHVPRPGGVSHHRHLSKGHWLWRPGHGRRTAQVPQHAGHAGVQQAL